MTAGPRPDLTGQILDRRFRVERLLGSGGMGTARRVQHVESLQALALKTIDPGLAANPEAVDWFLRERARRARCVRATSPASSMRRPGTCTTACRCPSW